MIIYMSPCDPMDALHDHVSSHVRSSCDHHMTSCDHCHPLHSLSRIFIPFLFFLSPLTGLSPSCDLEALVTQNPKMSSLVISLIATWLLISLAVVGVIGYFCARKRPKKGQSSGSQNMPPNRRVSHDGKEQLMAEQLMKEPLMTEFCWQAKVLKGGLSDVMGRRNSTLKRMLSPSDNEPWQRHVRRCSSVTYQALPHSPSPSASSTDIRQNRNNSYGYASLWRQENHYTEMEQAAA